MASAATTEANTAPRPTGRGRRGPKPPQSSLVLLVRHGTTPTTGQVLPGRAAGLHLADQGQREAEAVAERLAALAAAWRSKASRPGFEVAAVYASPLERARETASPIAQRLGLKVVIERGLVECDFGEWTGAELKTLRKLPQWAAVQRYPSGFQFPAGESFTGMRARLADTMAKLWRRHPGQAVVAVSHADPIKAVVSDALGTHLDLFQRIVVSPCSVTVISYHPTGPIVLAVNSTGTLAELRPA
jgi:probable phosphoglycerate mutase